MRSIQISTSIAVKLSTLHSISDLLQIETALPEIKTTLLQIETALPEINTTLPEIETALLQIETALLQIEIVSEDESLFVAEQCSSTKLHQMFKIG